MNYRDIMDPREFFKKLAMIIIGGSLFLNLLTLPSLGAYPWEETQDSVVAGSDGKFALSPIHRIGEGMKNEYPAVAVTSDDRIWVVYVSEKAFAEGIFLREFHPDGALGDEIPISTKMGYEYQPQVLAAGNNLHIVWAAKRDGKSRIFLRSVVNAVPGPEMPVSLDAAINWNPCLAADPKQNVWIVWESKEKNHFQIMACRSLEGNPDKPISVTKDEADNRRPSLCTAPDGTVWVAWDRYEGPGNFNVYLKPLNKPEAAEIRVTNHPASDLAPSIAADKEGRIWIGWHSNRKGSDDWDIPRWFYLKAYHNGEFYEPVSQPLDKNLEKDGTDQSFEFVQLACGEDGRIIVMGRPSHNFCLQWYKGEEWSRLYRFPKDGWGGRGKYIKAAFDQKRNLWATRRDLDMNVIQGISGMNGSYIAPVLKKIADPLEVPALSSVERNPKFAEWNGYHFYFGDIHAQTWMSDGMGDLDEFYLQHRDLFQDDFAALTDHDTFVGNGILPSEWEEQKEITTHYHEPGRFITFYGQEWTTARWPKAFGHKNIYHIDPQMPLLDHTDEGSDTTQKIFAQSKQLGAICIPHHIGWTGIDWENHDPEIQPLVEIVSSHGAYEYMGNQPIYHRGGVPGCFVQDGLAKGLKFGLIGGSDTHGLIWQHRVGWKRNCLRTGLTCILAKELTREALFDAMKKRRVYAVSGVKMRIQFELNGAIMGEEVTVTEKPQIKVDVTSPSDIKWIQIVRNNETIYTYGGEGYQSRFTFKDEKAEPGKSYYYVRVITEDGNMGWSSPIWVEYKA